MKFFDFFEFSKPPQAGSRRFTGPFDEKTEKSQRPGRDSQRVEPPAAARAKEHKGPEAPLSRPQAEAEKRKGQQGAEEYIRRRCYCRAPLPAPGGQPDSLERVVNYSQPYAQQQSQPRLPGLGIHRLLHAQPKSRLQKPPAGAASS